MRAKSKVFILSLFLAVPLGAQTRFEETVEEDFWLQSRNINGIRQVPVYSGRSAVSFAELETEFARGGFHEPGMADRSGGAGARAGTLLHLPRTSMLGTFSFEESRGKDMYGSMFIDGNRYPFDILEFTPGDKTLQTYAFTGGLTTALGREWSVGGTIRFESANYAKRKDIRHTNYRLDLSVEPAILYRGASGRAGMSLILRKQSESVAAEQVGSATADSYYAFLDKGLCYGSYQVWNGSGIHLAETGLNRFPVTVLSYGAALQGSLMEMLSGEAAYVRSRGEAGEKGFTWFTFPEDKVNILLEYRRGGMVTHWARLRYEGTFLADDETVLDRVTSGGITLPVLYGSNRIYRERKDRISATYRAVTPWDVGMEARLGYTREDRRSFLVYPYAATAGTGRFDAGLSFWRTAGRWRMTLKADFASRVRERETLDDLSGGTAHPESEPFRMEDWYRRQQEYRLADRADFFLSLRRAFPHGLYVQAEGRLLQGFRLEYLDSGSRLRGGLRLGIEF